MIPVLEPAETPIQRLLDTVGHGDNTEADNGFCKQESTYIHSTIGLIKSFHIILENLQNHRLN